MLPSQLTSTNMTQLTQEYFDQVTKGLATKNDLKPLATKEDVHTAVRAGVEELARMTADGFAHTEERLIKRMDESQSELARMVVKGFDDLQKRLDVRDQIIAHELKFQRIEEALHMKL